MSTNPYEPPKAEWKTTADHSDSMVGKLAIQFDITLDDIGAYYRHYVAHSRAFRRQRYLVIAVTWVGVLAICFWLSLEIQIPLGTMVLASLAFIAVFSVVYPALYTPWFVRNALKMFTSGSTEGILGAHELELDEVFLTERTNVNQMRQSLSAIERVEETDDYAFVYINALQAHIIPKRSVAAGDVDEFIRRLRHQVARASASGS